ncbi:hypothetical protein T03_16113 [Trichinella britovi]|uniref:Uncharacterized protein n=1 Tax=Trichinella britovi TaxID=45882 RepID=A0A0V1D0H3_TRIBR|nr:hypothetical protein T03_16113 [Trichinella britovi]
MASSTPLSNQFQFKAMPFGLCNAPLHSSTISSYLGRRKKGTPELGEVPGYPDTAVGECWGRGLVGVGPPQTPCRFQKPRCPTAPASDVQSPRPSRQQAGTDAPPARYAWPAAETRRRRRPTVTVSGPGGRLQQALDRWADVEPKAPRGGGMLWSAHPVWSMLQSLARGMGEALGGSSTANQLVTSSAGSASWTRSRSCWAWSSPSDLSPIVARRGATSPAVNRGNGTGYRIRDRKTRQRDFFTGSSSMEKTNRKTTPNIIRTMRLYTQDVGWISHRRAKCLSMTTASYVTAPTSSVSLSRNLTTGIGFTPVLKVLSKGHEYENGQRYGEKETTVKNKGEKETMVKNTMKEDYKEDYQDRTTCDNRMGSNGQRYGEKEQIVKMRMKEYYEEDYEDREVEQEEKRGCAINEHCAQFVLYVW